MCTFIVWTLFNVFALSVLLHEIVLQWVCFCCDKIWKKCFQFAQLHTVSILEETNQVNLGSSATSACAWPAISCLMKTFVCFRTLVSGQAVDTCCQELNGTPPSSWDMRSGGSYINTASWPGSLTPGAAHVFSAPLWPRDRADLQMSQVSLAER